MTNPAPCLQAKAVTVQFGSLKALDSVDLVLNRGEILGLIGPNGSGKTTLINAITGQVPLASGRVLCDGEDISALPPHERALRGFLRSFQTVRLFRDLTVAENVEVGLVAKGASGRRCHRGPACLRFATSNCATVPSPPSAMCR